MCAVCGAASYLRGLPNRRRRLVVLEADVAVGLADGDAGGLGLFCLPRGNPASGLNLISVLVTRFWMFSTSVTVWATPVASWPSRNTLLLSSSLPISVLRLMMSARVWR